MNGIEPIDQTLKKIKKRWDDDKEGWYVLSNIDRDGNKEMIIGQEPYSWWLKMRTVTPYEHMAYGKEIRNIGEEINEKIRRKQAKALDPNEQLFKQLGLFAMGVPIPKKQEILFTSGMHLHDPESVNEHKNIVEEKEKDADALYRKYLREKWKRIHQLRDNMYA